VCVCIKVCVCVCVCVHAHACVRMQVFTYVGARMHMDMHLGHLRLCEYATLIVTSSLL